MNSCRFLSSAANANPSRKGTRRDKSAPPAAAAGSAAKSTSPRTGLSARADLRKVNRHRANRSAAAIHRTRTSTSEGFERPQQTCRGQDRRFAFDAGTVSAAMRASGACKKCDPMISPALPRADLPSCTTGLPITLVLA